MEENIESLGLGVQSTQAAVTVYSQLESLDKPPLANVLLFLSDSEILTLRVLSRQMKNRMDTVLLSHTMLCVLLWRFIDETMPRFHVLRIPNQRSARNHNRLDFQPLKNILELCVQKLKYREFLWHGYTTGWRAQRITKTGLQMMIDAVALIQDHKLTFGQASELKHLLKEMASQVNFCTQRVTVIQQVPGFKTLEKVCGRISKLGLVLLSLMALPLGVMILFGVGSTIVPLLLIGAFMALMIGVIAMVTPIMVSEGHKCIVAHRALNLRTGFVNNLHRQFEDLETRVLASAEPQQIDTVDHPQEDLPLLPSPLP